MERRLHVPQHRLVSRRAVHQSGIIVDVIGGIALMIHLVVVTVEEVDSSLETPGCRFVGVAITSESGSQAGSRSGKAIVSASLFIYSIKVKKKRHSNESKLNFRFFNFQPGFWLCKLHLNTVVVVDVEHMEESGRVPYGLPSYTPNYVVTSRYILCIDVTYDLRAGMKMMHIFKLL